MFDISIKPRFIIGVDCYCFRWNAQVLAEGKCRLRSLTLPAQYHNYYLVFMSCITCQQSYLPQIACANHVSAVHHGSIAAVTISSRLCQVQAECWCSQSYHNHLPYSGSDQCRYDLMKTNNITIAKASLYIQSIRDSYLNAMNLGESSM